VGRYRKILVAVDGSDSGMHALRESFKLATNEKSWITVTSVVPQYTGDLAMVGVGNIMDSMRKPCEDALHEAEKAAKAEGALIKTTCEEGDTYERIVDLAEAENCDLIVMGRRGLHRFEKALMGSVTARVIGYSHRDVLVVPRDTTIGWQRILVATDGSRYSMTAVERAIDFAKSYGGELRVISVVDVPSEFYAEAPNAFDDLVSKAKGYVKDIRTQADSAGIKAEGFVGEGEAYQIITDVAKKEDVNIIVIGSHGRTGMKRLLMGSVTEKVIGHAPCPVLVVRV
jgi:nucleotide-binding universal stress UspA family protein